MGQYYEHQITATSLQSLRWRHAERQFPRASLIFQLLGLIEKAKNKSDGKSRAESSDDAKSKRGLRSHKRTEKHSAQPIRSKSCAFYPFYSIVEAARKQKTLKNPFVGAKKKRERRDFKTRARSSLIARKYPAAFAREFSRRECKRTIFIYVCSLKLCN